MNQAFKLLVSFAISLISTALIYQQFNLPGWENSAALGGAILFFVITIILGSVFKLHLVGALIFSLLITGFIMLFVLTIFGVFLILFGILALILVFAYESE